MRRARSVGLVLALTLVTLAASCQPPHLTTQGKVLWTATQISQRVEELQNTAIQANLTGALADGPAVLIVRFTVSAQKTLQALPEGWQASLVMGWAEMKKLLPPVIQASPALAAAIGAVDVILGTALEVPSGE